MKDIYFQALAGGALLGIGAFLLLYLNGKIAGISGITYQAIASITSQNSWRWCFLIGLIGAPLIATRLGFSLPDQISAPIITLAIAGLLVGIGTRMGSGCTSGHGICGIGRLSKRSIVATLIFMSTAVVTVAITRHIL